MHLFYGAKRKNVCPQLLMESQWRDRTKWNELKRWGAKVVISVRRHFLYRVENLLSTQCVEENIRK